MDWWGRRDDAAGDSVATVVFACGGPREAADEGARAGTLPELVRVKGTRASLDLAPKLAARWPAAGKTKTEEQAAP